jgi:hypothetical protein
MEETGDGKGDDAGNSNGVLQEIKTYLSEEYIFSFYSRTVT